MFGKKSKILFFCIGIILLSFLIYLFSISRTLNINSKEIYKVEVFFLSGMQCETTDPSEIKKIVKALNKDRYYKFKNIVLGSSCPDVWVTLTYRDGSESRIFYYGFIEIVAYGEYLGDRYKVNPFIYQKLEKICNDVNKKQEP